MKAMLRDVKRGVARLPDSLSALVQTEFVVAEGCFFLSSLYTNSNASLARQAARWRAEYGDGVIGILKVPGWHWKRQGGIL
jgi:hypothetical protein